MSLNEIRDRIMSIADNAIKYSRDLNIPSAEVFIFEQSSTDLTDHQGKIDSRDGLTQGVGIRVAEGKKLGFASGTGFDKEGIIATLNAAHKIAKESPDNPLFNGFVTETKTAKEGILDEAILNLDAADLIETCNLMSKDIDMSDKRIISGSYGVNTSFGGYALATTEGCLASSLITTYNANTEFVVTEAGDRKTGEDYVTGRKIQSTEKLAHNALTEALDSLGSKSFGGTEVLPTVWKARQNSAFLAFAFFTTFSGTAYVEKSNPWGEKLGERVATDSLTVIDDGQKPDDNACRAIDSEGTPKQTTTVIDKGILKTFLFNKMYAEAAGLSSTGNAQRGGFFGGVAYEGTPNYGPNKIRIKEGSKTLDEQLSEIKKGVLIVGEPIGMFTANPITGDFSVTCNDAFLILNGERANPLKSISIAGNYFKTLNDIRFIGNDTQESYYPLNSPSMTFMNHTISD